MTLSDAIDLLSRMLRFEIVHVGGAPITLVNLLTATVIVVVTVRVSRLAQRAIERALQRRKVDDPGTAALLTRSAHYAVLVAGLAMAMQSLGFDLGNLFAAGAVFAVGIGFAMQNIAQNFVSGIILLVERSIRPGDVLTVDGRVVRVEHMGIRSTVVRSLFDDEIIVPNSTLVQTSVVNHTFQDRLWRVKVMVGVHYDSDMDRVEAVLREVGDCFPGRVQDREPLVFLREFGSSSVDWELSIWTDDPWRMDGTQSRLRKAVWDGLKAAGIVIAYPQLDLHIDDRGLDALRAGGRPAASRSAAG